MNAVVQQNQAPQANPIAKLQEQFDTRESSFKAALPAHIPVERFMRVVMTATQRNPDLVAADRVSLFNSALLAAQDGLLPDGREGALVIYNTKKGNDWVKSVQWMPMIAGILKKCRNSGELSSVEAHTVHANDKFSYRIGIDEQPIHEPDWFGDRGAVVGVYAVARLKDGTRVSEIMGKTEIEKVRAISKSKDKGPWVDWWEEMARKTVLRRLSKRLPISSDLDDLIRRDDALYDFDGARQDAQQRAPRSLAGKLDALAKPNREPAAIEHQTGGVPTVTEAECDEAEAILEREPEPAKVTSGKPARTGADPAPGEAGPAGEVTDADDGRFPPLEGDAPPVDPMADARQRGAEAKRDGLGTRAMPGEYRAEGREAEAEAWLKGHKDGVVQMAEVR
ncbi:recombinase RecT [Boseaceae bacterium BT-24-1]|nr:recombinase RecT [Boseaceae bacterium BT-24-1]